MSTVVDGQAVNPLGERLLRARRELRRSLKAVAPEAGISPAYLQKLEAGRVKSPSPRVLEALAGVLQISYHELMGLTGYAPAAEDNGRTAEGTGGRVDRARIEKAVREILEAIGEDPDREGLRQTPQRVAAMYDEVFSGLADAPDQHLSATFAADHDEMVMVTDIPMFSHCEHHLTPFFGKAHVAYIPNSNGRITGLSTLARLVDSYARRPQVQERLTTQIADEINRSLQPRGVLVVIEAEHLCMSMRGVKKPGTTTVTSAVRGAFRRNAATRNEALDFIRR
jgi:GTP cyclohydrolase I